MGRHFQAGLGKHTPSDNPSVIRYQEYRPGLKLQITPSNGADSPNPANTEAEAPQMETASVLL